MFSSLKVSWFFFFFHLRFPFFVCLHGFISLSLICHKCSELHNLLIMTLVNCRRIRGPWRRFPFPLLWRTQCRYQLESPCKQPQVHSSFKPQFVAGSLKRPFPLFLQGQLYKVNVPVVVSQAQAGQQPASHPPPRVTEWRDAPALQPAVVPPHPVPPRVPEPSALPASSITHPRPSLPLCQESSLPHIDLTLGDNEPTPPPEPVNVSTTASPCTQLLDLQIRAEEALAQTTKGRDIYDILKEVIEKETEKVERSRDVAAGNSSSRSEAALQVNSMISLMLFPRTSSKLCSSCVQ